MPHAASIPATTITALPILPAKSEVPSQPAFSGKEFGELFRKQVEPVQSPVVDAMSVTEKSGNAKQPLLPGQTIKTASGAEPQTTQAPEPQAQLHIDSVAAKSETGRKSIVQISSASPEKPTQPQQKTAQAEAAPTLAVHHNTSPSAQAQPEVPSAAPVTSPAPAAPAHLLAIPPPAEQTAAAPISNREASATRVQSSKEEPEEKGVPLQSASSKVSSSSPLQTEQQSGEDRSNSTSPSGSSAAMNAGSEAVPVSPGISSSIKETSTQHTASSAAQTSSGRLDTPSIPAATHSARAEPSLVAPPRVELGTGAMPSIPANPTASAPPNLYDRIDQGSAPVLLHSGIQHVAVGVRDPDLGWVEIRTQNMSGHVDATLLTTSGQTHSSLASQLPAMAEYLQQRDVRVGTLTVHHEMAGSNAGSGHGNGPGYGGAENGQTANRSTAESDAWSSRTQSAVTPGYPKVSSDLEEANVSLRPVSYISVHA